jgi:D-alanyl-D-alanine carboxypeptidase (penicillin-binding protein 5/6)
LGMFNTHFSNACGHDAADHYSTVQDLAILANAALKKTEIVERAVKESLQIADVSGSKTYVLHTKNALLGRYAGTLGLKTGYTPRAGKCLIAYVERHGVKVLLVMLHGNNRWWDAVDLLDLAFAQAQYAS